MELEHLSRAGQGAEVEHGDLRLVLGYRRLELRGRYAVGQQLEVGILGQEPREADRHEVLELRRDDRHGGRHLASLGGMKGGGK
jgi:hypothetical protein